MIKKRDGIYELYKIYTIAKKFMRLINPRIESLAGT